LLTSRVWNQEKDTQIWENESEQILGFAMIWRRQPKSAYIVLDGYLHPNLATNGLFTGMLQWGDNRANEIAKEQETELTVYVTGLSQQDFSTNLLGEYSYSIVPEHPNDNDVYFAKSLHDKILVPSLPAGYKIRNLHTIEDLQAYQALYGFAKVNPYHQKELIESDEYHHFVVVNPSGEFVAYCECSACYAEWERTDQRIGWIDYVETKSEEQRKGLGWAILTAGLLQLQEMGADTAMLITINTNLCAVSLYDKTGFHRAEMKEYPSYQKQIAFTLPGSLTA
jgi:ribosomal protein S18 acetylase RimI-like enzyme